MGDVGFRTCVVDFVLKKNTSDFISNKACGLVCVVGL